MTRHQPASVGLEVALKGQTKTKPDAPAEHRQAFSQNDLPRVSIGCK
jgi:hypothetical protein